MKKLKKSRFAFFVKKDNGHYIVYSSLSGAVILFKEKKYINLLERAISKDVFAYRNTDFCNLMLEKRIFIEENEDEDLTVRGIYEERIIRSTTLELMLIVTRQCNFRCIYCGQPHLDKTMKADTYAAVLNFIKRQVLERGYTHVQLNFFGGEPLIESEEICQFLKQVDVMLDSLSTCERRITYSAGMSTNGYLLSPQVFDKLIALNCNFFQISIDGMSETHDKMRPLISGKPTWDRIVRNVAYMISTDQEFSILLRTNFNVEVADSLVEFYKYMSENLNDKRISIYYETIKDHGNEMTPDTICGMEELVLDVDIAQLVRENGLVCENLTRRLMPCNWACYASKPNFYVIDESAQMLKCSFALDDASNIIGKLDLQGICYPNGTKYNDWVYKDYLTSEMCKQCKALPLCFGKKCPKTMIQLGEMQCNIDMIQAEIEGLLNSYY